LPITDAQVAEWHEHGYVLVPDFLSGEQLDAARDNAYRYFPTAAEYYAAPQRYKNLPRDAQFPFAGDALNNISTGAELVGAARRIVGSDDVFLTQSLLWAKYAGRGDWEQPHHVDYQNNSLVVPSDAPGFRQTGSILYLEDVTLELGPTYLVPRGASRG
jgi:ectoine hydroxylase-related dioxygenase (phytanoyl-CoA dioxygenase family)